jgi:membrane-bound serine protease (ClpP class)
MGRVHKAVVATKPWLRRLLSDASLRISLPFHALAMLIVAATLTLVLSPAALAQDRGAGTSELVVVIPITGTIEPGIGHFLERSLAEAEARGATAVILDINTPGGRLDTVLEMRDALLGSPLRIIAFVNREAFSAGALITIASVEIWVAPGGVFGAATPVLGSETASAKTVSAVRSTFRSTAETRGRDPLIAEAMVDPAVEVPGLDSGTTLLTLTSDQALQWDYADGVATDRNDLLAQLGLSGAEVTEMSPTVMETIVRWVTDPIVASLLIMLGLFLIVADALFGGLGVAAAAGVLCFGLFFWGHLLADLAGWEDLLLIAIGLGLIALEVFVIPGFGIAGIAGTLALGAGLFLAMIGRGFWQSETQEEAIRAGWSVAIGLLGALVAIVAVGWTLSRIGTARSGRPRGIGRLALTTTVSGDTRDTVPRTAHPGWLVRHLGGGGVLERGGETMPDTQQHKNSS